MSRGSLMCALALVATILAATPARALAACVPAPLAGCGLPSGPNAARLWLNVRGSELRTSLVWKWYHVDATPVPRFDDPTVGTDYAICIYHEPSGSDPVLLFDADVPAGESCGSNRPCWTSSGEDSFKYRDGTATPQGITKVILNDRGAGGARIIVKGRGALLAVPNLPLAVPARLQLQADDGRCWESLLSADGVFRNTASQFRGGSQPR